MVDLTGMPEGYHFYGFIRDMILAVAEDKPPLLSIPHSGVWEEMELQEEREVVECGFKLMGLPKDAG